MTKKKKNNNLSDVHVADAIKRKKKEFIDFIGTQHDSMDIEDTWIFNHVCTVLDHAEKMFRKGDDMFDLANELRQDAQ